MMLFSEQLGQLTKIVLNQFGSNFFGESLSLVILGIVLVLILIARSEMCNYFESKGKEDKINLLFNLLAEISFPLIYFIFLSYISVYFNNVKVSFLIFNSFIYLYFGFIIVKYSRNIPTITESYLWIYALNALIVIAAVSHLFTNLSINFYYRPTLLNTFVFLLENSVKYVFFIIFFRSIRFLFENNKHRFSFAQSVLKGLYPMMYYLYTAVFVALLWMIVIIKLNYSYFIGLLSVLIVITLFVITKTHITPLFHRNRESDGIYFGSFHGISESLQTLVILGGAWVMYNISLKYFNFEVIVNYLSSKYVVITDLVDISYFSLITDAFLFLILFALIGLLKNLLSIYDSSRAVSKLRNP